MSSKLNIVAVTRDNQVLLTHVGLANTLWTRFKGLLGQPQQSESQGLLIIPCNSIHTMWMRHRIDVVFIDKTGCITRVVPNIKPWRMAGSKKAKLVLELRAGRAGELGLASGQMINWY